MRASGQGRGIFHHLLLVGLERIPHGFLEGHGLGGDHVHEGPALDPGENLFVQNPRQVRSGEDQTAPGPPEGLVGGGSHHVGQRHRRGMKPGADKTCDVGHVHHEDGPHASGDLGENLKVDDARVGTGPGHDHFGAMLQSQLPDFIVIDAARLFPDPVVGEIEKAAGKIDRAAVGKVPAVGEVHPQDRIPGREVPQVYAPMLAWDPEWGWTLA